MQEEDHHTSAHYVFISDDDGMNFIYPELKEKLSDPAPHHITLVYYSLSNAFIFCKELEILLRRFPTQFIWYCQALAPYGEPKNVQENIEVILNANTKKDIYFILAGHEELINTATNALHFLDIHKDQIRSIF